MKKLCCYAKPWKAGVLRMRLRDAGIENGLKGFYFSELYTSILKAIRLKYGYSPERTDVANNFESAIDLKLPAIYVELFDKKNRDLFDKELNIFNEKYDIKIEWDTRMPELDQFGEILNY